METKKINVIDKELTKLIDASNHGPLPWAAQQKLVDLFMDFCHETGMAHKEHVEKLEAVVWHVEQATKHLKQARVDHVNCPRGC